MANFTSIRTSLLNLLKTLSSVDSTKVKGYGTVEPTGYPFITLETLGNESEATDEKNIERIYKYRIRVYINMDKEQAGIEWAEDTLLVVLDEIADKIDNDYTLSNTVDWIETVDVNTGYTENAEGTMRIAEIELKIHKLYQLT